MGKVKNVAIDSIKISSQFIIDCMERVIRGNQEAYQQLNTNKKINDFRSGDIVKCAYLKDFLKVVGPTSEEKVILVHLNCREEGLAISPDFLKKVPVNSKAIKVLYES
jgi:hypothetical protein